MGAPRTLPADFFEKLDAQQGPPPTLPADFFDKMEAQAKPVERPGVLSRFAAPFAEAGKGIYELVRRNVSPRPGEANLLQRVAGPGPGIVQDVATGLLGAHREAGEEFQKEPGVRSFLEAGVPLAGPLHRSLRKKIEVGDYAGALGETALTVAPFKVPAVTRTGVTVGKAGAQAIRHPIRTSVEMLRKPEVAQSVVKEALSLPPLAISGVEDIFRAAAPTGKKAGFRSSAYTAAGDLAEIGEKLELKQFRGGAVNPDLRPRATVNAMNEHLSKMFQEERLPQIQRQAERTVAVKLGTDAQEAMKFLEKSAGKAEDRALVASAREADVLSVENLDNLERLVSAELAPFRKMTAQERAAAGITNRRYGGLKALHDELRNALNDELRSAGEVGLTQYERRYAALSGIRDQLRDRLNAIELERTLPLQRTTRGFLGGKTGIASASQAAIADVNIGQLLEDGFARLQRSGVRRNRGVVTPPTPYETPPSSQRTSTKGLGIRLTQMNAEDANNWIGYTGQKTLTVYRGVPSRSAKIEPGDFVTTNPEYAKKYGPHVIQEELSTKDLLYFSGHKNGDPSLLGQGFRPQPTELIYRPLKKPKRD